VQISCCLIPFKAPVVLFWLLLLFESAQILTLSQTLTTSCVAKIVKRIRSYVTWIGSWSVVWLSLRNIAASVWVLNWNGTIRFY
jgi:hypothetical protein